MHLAIDLTTNGKESKTILYECCEYYCQGFNKRMKKEKGKINGLAYMGEWLVLFGVEPNFCPWQRALSEYV